MPILVNRETMLVHAKHPSSKALADLANIELAHKHVVILGGPDNDHTLDFFSMYELTLLYKNLTGEKVSTHYRPALTVTLQGMLAGLADSDVNSFEVAVQSLAIAKDSDGHYLYVRGSHLPSPQQELTDPPPRTVPGLRAAIHPPPAQVVPQAPSRPAVVLPPAQAVPGAVKPPWLK